MVFSVMFSVKIASVKRESATYSGNRNRLSRSSRNVSRIFGFLADDGGGNFLPFIIVLVYAEEFTSVVLDHRPSHHSFIAS